MEKDRMEKDRMEKDNGQVKNQDAGKNHEEVRDRVQGQVGEHQVRSYRGGPRNGLKQCDHQANVQVFNNRHEVVRWLNANGYKVQKSKLYKDVQAGLLRIEADGRVTIEAVRRYIDHPNAGISSHMKTVRVGDDLEIKDYHRRAAIAKAEKTELEAAKLRWEMEREQGKWLPRSALEMEMAGRAAVLMQGLNNLVQMQADNWVRLVDGDMAKGPVLRASLLVECERLMNSYASMDTYQVLFEDELSGQPDEQPDGQPDGQQSGAERRADG